MPTTTVQLTPLQELDARNSDGLEIRLLWDPDSNSPSIEVHDSRLGDTFELDVDPAHALDAFHHPYAYAAHRGITFTDPRAPQLEPVSA